VFITTPARADEIIRPTDLHALGMVRGELSRTRALLSDLEPAEWQRPSDCAGRSVHDVVAHMIGQYEELSRPARLICRIRMARRLAGTSGRDGRSEAQIHDRAGHSSEQLIAELAYWGRKATLAAERIPGPLHRIRASIFFPAAHAAPEDTIDYFIRVLMPREAWMHRTDIAIATGRPVGVGAHDGEIVRQVIRDVACAWSGPAMILDLTGPVGGRWLLGEEQPVAEVHSDPVSYVRLAAGRLASEPLISGDSGAGATLLATRIAFCPGGAQAAARQPPQELT
jgi:uncharacterized protein (TIGR03083 family)